MTSFSILRQDCKISRKVQVLNTFENIMENGAFAPMEQILHFPYYFQIYDISKAPKGVYMEYRVDQYVVQCMFT